MNEEFTELTVRVNDAVCVTEPAVPVSVIGYCPAGVEVNVETFTVTVQPGFGVQEDETGNE